VGGIRNASLLISAAEAKERVMKIQHFFDKRTSTQIGDALFVGDTIFMPDYGTARCDFPGGSASTGTACPVCASSASDTSTAIAPRIGSALNEKDYLFEE
jgi:hypothetical protein